MHAYQEPACLASHVVIKMNHCLSTHAAVCVVAVVCLFDTEMILVAKHIVWVNLDGVVVRVVGVELRVLVVQAPTTYGPVADCTMTKLSATTDAMCAHVAPCILFCVPVRV